MCAALADDGLQRRPMEVPESAKVLADVIARMHGRFTDADLDLSRDALLEELVERALPDRQFLLARGEEDVQLIGELKCLLSGPGVSLPLRAHELERRPCALSYVPLSARGARTSAFSVGARERSQRIADAWDTRLFARLDTCGILLIAAAELAILGGRHGMDL
ncbi:MAG: hypothetical protein IT456_28390 [Planctomycetes bacterium]|nr:hypothetical protein [Planctomycetota bacterium]